MKRLAGCPNPAQINSLVHGDGRSLPDATTKEGGKALDVTDVDLLRMRS